MTTTKSSVFIKNLINKQTQQSTETEKMVFGLICKLTKMLETLKDEYLNSSKSSFAHLNEKETQALELIEKGEIQNLKPILISNVIKSLLNKDDKESK